MSKRWRGAALALLVLVLVGCGTRTDRDAPKQAEQTFREVRVVRPRKKCGEAVLYIGRAGQYGTYRLPYEGEAAPDQLIGAIAALTGWDLSLDGPVLRDASGITVTFSERCALFTGPPEPQREDFFVYDAQELCEVLLDSVCRTLQWNAVNPKLEDPKALPVYFRGPEGNLVLEDIGFTQPEDIPYGGLVPGAEVCCGQGRLLRVTAEGEGIFDMESGQVAMAPYDSDVAAALERVTPGRSVRLVYLLCEEKTILTGIYANG